jgi:DNA-binding NarL/FixJ family response regulator
VIQVAVVEDDARYRQSLTALFAHANGFALAGAFAAPQPALAQVEAARRRGQGLPWSLVLMDVELPGMNGIEATRRLKAASPDTAVVVLTVFEEPSTILQAICAGADGYLLKRTPADELLAQLRSVVAGGSPLTSDVARKVLGLLRTQAPASAIAAPPTRLDLTDREHEVLKGLVQGLAYKQIGDQLGISLDTVRTHIRAVYRKLQVHSVAEAVSRAVREGLV